MKNKKTKFNFYTRIIIAGLVIFLPASVYAALSCSITTAGACADTVLLRMSGSTNAHAELPGQTTPVYDDNVVCCSGPAGLGNSCSGNYKVIDRLSGVTNAHVEENTQANVNYTENACLSSIFAGDEITVGYQASNCTGYDTTLFSMEKTPTNSQVGDMAAYNNKVCATIFSQTISFNISDSSIGFGYLTPATVRYATADGSGSLTETQAFSIDASTNAPFGYNIMMEGGTLANNSNGSILIDAIGHTPITPTVGTKAFGLRAEISSGSGTILSPYDTSDFAFDSTSSIFVPIAEDTSGSGTVTTYSMRSAATIDSILAPGAYSTNLTYIMTASF